MDPKKENGADTAQRSEDTVQRHADQLMRINAQMFESSIRALGQQNYDLRQQVSEVSAENSKLRRELDEAQSNKMEREFLIAMAAETTANLGGKNLDNRKLQVARVAGTVASGMVTESIEATRAAQISVDIAEAIFQKVGL